MSKPEHPSMDQLWDRPPAEPTGMDREAWSRWVASLSPEARQHIEQALAIAHKHRPGASVTFTFSSEEGKRTGILLRTYKNGGKTMWCDVWSNDAMYSMPLDSIEKETP